MKPPCTFYESSLKAGFCLLLLTCELAVLTSCTGPRTAVHQTVTPLDTLYAYQAALDHDDAESAYRLLAPTLKQRISYQQFLTDWQQTAPERAAQRQQIFGAKGPRDAPTTLQGATAPSRASQLVTQAIITLPQGTSLVLGYTQPPPASTRAKTIDKSSWQIVDSDLTAVHADTPEQLLRLLVNAAEQRNYFAVLRLFSATERQAIEAELRERLDRLRISLNNLSSKPLVSLPQTSAAESPNLPNASSSPPFPPFTNPSGKASGTLEIRGDRIHYQYDPRFFIDLVRQKDGWRVLDLN